MCPVGEVNGYNCGFEVSGLALLVVFAAAVGRGWRVGGRVIAVVLLVAVVAVAVVDAALGVVLALVLGVLLDCALLPAGRSGRRRRRWRLAARCRGSGRC